MACTKQVSSKARRKMARYLGILEKDYPDICPSKEPTKFIFIGNAGLTTNADEVCLTELINAIVQGLESVSLIPGKSYSFASFYNAEDAQVVMAQANGQHCIKDLASPVYMSYVDKIPVISSAVKYKLPPGLHVFEEFVSDEEEALLLTMIDWNEVPTDTAEGSALKHRQVRHFGYEFKYGNNSVDKEKPLIQGIPKALTPIVNRIVKRGIMQEFPDQLTVNRYLPGHGIPPHVDTHCSFTDEILSLSTGSGIIMDFRHVCESTLDQSQNGPHCAVYLKQRSLCAMTGPSRFEWTHGICPRMTDVVPAEETGIGLCILPRQERVSFTFRKIREGNCCCGNKLVCDAPELKHKGGPLDRESSAHSSTSDINGENAAQLEKDHVLAVYDQIANHFSVTRHKPWPNVLEFVSSLSPGSLLLDVGCGNGKYLGLNKSIFKEGCDTSIELTKICRDRGFEVLNCNCLQLPYRSSLFDAVICIAVIHHLASEERRAAAVQEMVRVLSSGGRGLIYVWAMEQKREKKKSTYLKQNRANRKGDSDSVGGRNPLKLESEEGTSPNSLPVHINRTEFVEQDMLVPWKLKTPKKPEEKRTPCKNLSSGNIHSPKDHKLSNLTNENEVDESVPVFHRFYHIFRQSELESLCKGIGGLSIVNSYYDEGNWCVIFEKS